MSYDKCKYISINKKNGKIFCTSAESNVRPLYYYKWEFLGKEEDLVKKGVRLLKAILDGELHISPSTNKMLSKAVYQSIPMFDWKTLGYKNSYSMGCYTKEWEDLWQLNRKAWGFDVPWDKRNEPENVEIMNKAEYELNIRLIDLWNRIT